jgi:uncharacterized membrane protein YoaK (UPF0700 family)
LGNVAVEPDSAVYALAYHEGKAAIAEQSATLKETRDRAGTIVSGAAVVAGLGVSFGIKAGKLSGWGVASASATALAFIVLAFAAAMVWRPFEGVFTLDAAMIVGSYAEGTPPADLAESHRNLAIHLGGHAAFNRDRLDDRLHWFSVVLYAFIAEVLFLIVTLVDLSR